MFIVPFKTQTLSAQNLLAGKKAEVTRALGESLIKREKAEEYDPKNHDKPDPVVAVADADEKSPAEGTVAEMKAWLEDRDIDVPGGALKADLVELVAGALEDEEPEE